ncbi:hypothetical protein BZA05DRAFT_110721 [Tricharina praecox]|uniref:uncharacterized protein n=1 Tax=Tricharina praecox TaxID=43433 RepID=UPI00221F24CD|nr:uncharacterized protein BZA05DRAFT_110721 [Tricharina praecox]KAI5857951.1 hypothetical protein BZA05DRAFT_110721 [Tricharina praecox]
MARQRAGEIGQDRTGQWTKPKRRKKKGGWRGWRDGWRDHRTRANRTVAMALRSRSVWLSVCLGLIPGTGNGRAKGGGGRAILTGSLARQTRTSWSNDDETTSPQLHKSSVHTSPPKRHASYASYATAHSHSAHRTSYNPRQLLTHLMIARGLACFAIPRSPSAARLRHSRVL